MSQPGIDWAQIEQSVISNSITLVFVSSAAALLRKRIAATWRKLFKEDESKVVASATSDVSTLLESK